MSSKNYLLKDYKNFNKSVFKTELKELLQSNSVDNYKSFEEIFLQTLNKHAPVKQKTVRGTHAPYMTKVLRKAIMKRSELKTKYYKHRRAEDLVKFKKHKNFCSRLYKKERKKYYESLDLKSISDNKKFWSTVKPFLSDKSGCSSRINLIDELGEVISEDREIAETFSAFFRDAVKSLDIKSDTVDPENFDSLTDPIDSAIKKFENHPSIVAIKSNVQPNTLFNFKEVGSAEKKFYPWIKRRMEDLMIYRLSV